MDHAQILVDSHLERVCRHLGIEIRFEVDPPFPLQKTIDRLHATLLHRTARFRPLQFEGDPLQFASMLRLDQLWSALYQGIVDDIGQEIQQGIGEGQGVPAQLWQQARERGFIPRTLPKHIPEHRAPLLLLSRTVERRMRHRGIALEHLNYHLSTSDLIHRRCGLPWVNAPVQITFYPEDLSRLWAFDSSSQHTFELEAIDQEYAADLSLWKHRVIKQFARSHSEEYVDLAALRRAKARIQQLIEDEYDLRKDFHGGRVRP